MPAVMPHLNKPQIAVSGCLLGEAVRYDGTDKYNDLICTHLSKQFEMISLCPEVGAGLDTPRPPVRLTGDPQRPLALGVEDPGLDVTFALESFTHEWCSQAKNISGLILKSRSPSCGLWDTPVVDGQGHLQSSGPGLFSRIVARHYPLLPVEDENGIADPKRLDSFISSVKLYATWHIYLSSGMTSERLLDFHRQLPGSLPKSVLTALKRILEQHGRESSQVTANSYFQILMMALKSGAHKPEAKA